MLQKIEMAQNLASQFQPNEAGVRQLMAQQGKSVNDIRSAVDALKNPMVAGFLNRVAPGMTQQLQSAGNTLISNLSSSSPASPSTSPSSSLDTPVDPVYSSFQERLNALKRKRKP